MSDERKTGLIAVHICKSCGGATERSQVNDDHTITGLVQCAHCGFEGDLNLEVIEDPKNAKPPKKDSRV